VVAIEHQFQPIYQVRAPNRAYHPVFTMPTGLNSILILSSLASNHAQHRQDWLTRSGAGDAGGWRCWRELFIILSRAVVGENATLFRTLRGTLCRKRRQGPGAVLAAPCVFSPLALWFYVPKRVKTGGLQTTANNVFSYKVLAGACLHSKRC